jgi:hypothetical protein
LHSDGALPVSTGPEYWVNVYITFHSIPQFNFNGVENFPRTYTSSFHGKIRNYIKSL